MRLNNLITYFLFLTHATWSCNMEANFCMKDKKKVLCSVIDLGAQRNKKELRYVLDF